MTVCEERRPPVYFAGGEGVHFMQVAADRFRDQAAQELGWIVGSPFPPSPVGESIATQAGATTLIRG